MKKSEIEEFGWYYEQVSKAGGGWCFSKDYVSPRNNVKMKIYLLYIPQTQWGLIYVPEEWSVNRSNPIEGAVVRFSGFIKNQEEFRLLLKMLAI